MKRSNRSRRSRTSLAAALALALAAAAAASGCEIIADFDRTKIDAGDDTFEDAALYDAQYPGADASPGVDANTPPSEASANEGGDSSQVDGGLDVNAPDGDANVADTNVADTNVADTNVADTNVADTNVADTNAPDTGDDGGTD